MPGMSQKSLADRHPVIKAALILLGAGSLGLSGCGSTTAGGTGSVRTDALTFENSTIPVAYVGEEFKANLMVSGGAGPYAYKVASGSLPPGMRYSGGLLSGTPTQAGVYRFSVEASDANLSNKVASYTLNVNELPPLSLEPTLPPGEIRGETRVPVVVKAPRAVRAARFTWDVGKDVQVTRVQAADNSSPVFWRQEGSVLSVDLGFKVVPRSGARVALVTVKPVKPVALNSSNFWFDSRDGAGKVLGEKKPPTPVPATPAPAAPASTAPVPGSSAPADAVPAAPAPATPLPTTPASSTTEPVTPTPPQTPPPAPEQKP